MLTSKQFCKQSLGLHLFFLRIMKEHAFFLEVGFPPKNMNYAQRADRLKVQLEELLERAVSLSDCVVDADILSSGEVFTPYTLDAENVTQNLSGVRLATRITKQEMSLKGDNNMDISPMLEHRVEMLNERAENSVCELIRFKEMLLCEVLECKLYTTNYPLLIEHILREAKLYLEMIHKLQNRDDIEHDMSILSQERFWNQIMAEHSEFIRGLLDPTEEELIMTANNFAEEFNELTKEAIEAMEKTASEEKVTEASLEATEQIKAFKTAGVQGLLNCKIRSIIIPLLADHVLREANHYLRILKMFEDMSCENDENSQSK